MSSSFPSADNPGGTAASLGAPRPGAWAIRVWGLCLVLMSGCATALLFDSVRQRIVPSQETIFLRKQPIARIPVMQPVPATVQRTAPVGTAPVGTAPVGTVLPVSAVAPARKDAPAPVSESKPDVTVAAGGPATAKKSSESRKEANKKKQKKRVAKSESIFAPPARPPNGDEYVRGLGG
ncbi:MAG: hypothetical protein V4632_08570 [Pseudomonadota bacterium]